MLLSYQFSTDPAPIQASSPGTEAKGRINVSVVDPTGGQVYCSSILIAVPIGDDPTDLAAVETTLVASLNTGRWTVSSATSTPDPLPGEGQWAKFLFQPLSADPSDWKIDFSLVLGLEAVVNAAPGQFQYAVEEVTGTDPGNLTPSTATFPLQKATPEFYLQNMVAVAPGSPTVPATEFGLGAPILVEWESNGTWFELYEKGAATPIYAGTETSFEIAGGLSTDTTLVLVAAVTGDPSQDQPSAGYGPIYLYDALTLTVSNPALTPSSVAASGALSAASVEASGAVSAASVEASGAASAASLAVSGDAVVGGMVTAGPEGGSAFALTVNGASAFYGSVNAPEQPAAFASVSTGTFDAQAATLPVITVGNWNITEDGSGNLQFTNSQGGSLTLGPGGGAWVAGKRIVADGDPINVYSPGRGAYLNATSAYGSDSTPTRWKAWNYLMENPDGDSNLQMGWGNPF